MSPTVGEALTAFRARHGLSPDDRPQGAFVVEIGPLRVPLPQPGRLSRHDLHHLVLDAPPGFWGEVTVSAFELRTGVPTWFIGLLCVGALALGMIASPQRTLRAWRGGRASRNLYDDPRDDVALRAMPLETLRAELFGVQSPGVKLSG